MDSPGLGILISTAILFGFGFFFFEIVMLIQDLRTRAADHTLQAAVYVQEFTGAFPKYFIDYFILTDLMEFE
jgi:hypothetical protein